MNEQGILEELLALLETNDVTIRSEPLGGEGGGLCTIKGKRVLFVDTEAPSIVTAAICAQSLPKVADIEQIYIKPQVRQFIADHSDKIS
jgi:hypothetical protein